ncbi:MAG: OmpA family protein [Candidatus Aureabacteria bacterium]|nr:OmpA family protein [Candidatus Auribacterota bacterium]
MKKTAAILSFLFIIGITFFAVSGEKSDSDKDFQWWPTDAKPGPVKDDERGGYWWWPEYPGQVRPYGNRGFVYVNKIIPGSEGEPAIVIKKIFKNVKIYFDTDKADIRGDAVPVLETGVTLLRKNPQSTILITGNCDARGKEAYNMLLGEKRGEVVKNYMIQHGVPEERIRIVSKGKLNAVAPVGDIEGMQKDRNAQFMVADIIEVPMTEWTQGTVKDVKEIAPEVRVEVKEYSVQKGDTLWKISEKVYGDPTRWTRIFDANKNKLKSPNDLKVGQILEIPLN